MTMTDRRRIQLGARIPVTLHEDLKRHSDETGISMSRLVSDALRAFLRERAGKGS